MRRRASTIKLEPWAFPGRPRVLIEHPEPDAALELAGALRGAGCTVGICRGPSTAPPATRCPLHGLEPCVAVEGADLVVTALDLRDPEARGVLKGLRTRYPRTPVVLMADTTEASAVGEVVEGCEVVPAGGRPEPVVEKVRALLSDLFPDEPKPL